MLPYVAQMPKELLGPDPSVISQLLASIWHGWEVAGTQGAARAAAAECYVECLTWTISRSPDVRAYLRSKRKQGNCMPSALAISEVASKLVGMAYFEA